MLIKNDKRLILEEPNTGFEQELEEKLLSQINAPAVASHKEVVKRIKNKFAFNNLSDEQITKMVKTDL